MINAIYSNPNFYQEDIDIPNIIHDLEENFKNSVDMVYEGKLVQEEEIDKSNPFFAPIDKGLPPAKEEGGNKKEEMEINIDQE